MTDINKVIIFELEENANYLMSTLSDMDTNIVVDRMSKLDLQKHKGETFWKALIFVKESSEIQPKLEEFKQNFDLESGGEITMVAEGEIDESVQHENIVWTESIKRVSTWWPRVLLRWFGKPRNMITTARPSCFFVFDADNDMAMYKETSKALEDLGLPCYWPGHEALSNPDAFEANHDFVKHFVVLCRGDGMKMAETNLGYIQHFACDPVEKILMFANQPASNVVQYIGTLPPRTKMAYPFMESLSYRLWVSFLRELDFISCEDVVFVKKYEEPLSSTDCNLAMKIILVLLFWPFIVLAFVLFVFIFLAACLNGVILKPDVIYEKMCQTNKVDPGNVQKWVYKV